MILNQSRSYRNHHAECFRKKRAHNKRHTNSCNTSVHLKHKHYKTYRTCIVKHAKRKQTENLPWVSVESLESSKIPASSLLLVLWSSFYWKGMSHLFTSKGETVSSSLTTERVTNRCPWVHLINVLLIIV